MWYGSGFGLADPYLLLIDTDPDPDPDPVSFVSDLQDVNKIFFSVKVFLLITF